MATTPARTKAAAQSPRAAKGDDMPARDEQALEEVLRALTAARDGDFTVRVTRAPA